MPSIVAEVGPGPMITANGLVYAEGSWYHRVWRN